MFGQSSGGALTLETAAAGVPMRALLVNEPPFTGTEGSSLRTGETARRAGRRRPPDRAVELFLRGTGLPEPGIEQTKTSPTWPGMVGLAHTLAYDIRLCNDGIVPVDRLARISCPVLATAGGASPRVGTRRSAGESREPSRTGSGGGSRVSATTCRSTCSRRYCASGSSPDPARGRSDVSDPGQQLGGLELDVAGELVDSFE